VTFNGFLLKNLEQARHVLSSEHTAVADAQAQPVKVQGLAQRPERDREFLGDRAVMNGDENLVTASEEGFDQHPTRRSKAPFP